MRDNIKGMLAQNKTETDPEFMSVYNAFKKKILNEENKEQVKFLDRKVRNAIFIAKKFSQNEGLSIYEFRVTQVYIFLFYFRLIDSLEDIAVNEKDAIEVDEEKVINKDKIYEEFELTERDRSQLTAALDDYLTPIGMRYSMSLKVGHDAIASIFGKKKVIDNLSEIIDEFEFYFPSLEGNQERFNIILDYLSKTRYYSDAAKDKHLARKIKNRKKIIKYIQKQKAASSKFNTKRAMTVIKTSSRNQIDLLSIADKKAGIMITVNSILLTILIPLFASYIFDFSSYIIPIIILVVTCGLTILLATLATRPSASPKDKEKTDKLLSGERSIFYFKNFARLPKNKFVDEAIELLSRDAAFEKTIFTDLYDVGYDLDRKYTRLRWCYTIFASGIVLTMVSFVLSVLFVTVH